VFRRITCSSK